MFFHKTGKVHVAAVREHAYPYPGTDVIDKVRMGRGCAVISHGYSKYLSYFPQLAFKKIP